MKKKLHTNSSKTYHIYKNKLLPLLKDLCLVLNGFGY